MKKKISLIFMLIFSLIFSGCTNIATPEELLEPPELNLEKKSIKEALENFIPQDSVNTALPNLDGVDKEKAYTPININEDEEPEMISFYKHKNTKLIGMLILSKRNNKWIKLANINLNAYDISQFKVIDLDNNGTKEIILGTFSDESVTYGKKLSILGLVSNEIISIVDTPYIAMEVGDMDGDKNYEIAVLKQNEEIMENRLNLLKISGTRVTKLDEKLFPQGVDPYSITIGYLYNEKMAIFVDSFYGIYEGRTDIYLIEEQQLIDIKDYIGLKLDDKSFPVQTKDIDSDGIMEIGIPFLPPDNKPLYDPLKPWVKSYYKINPDTTLTKVKQIYEDYKMSFIFEIPESFSDNYSITSNTEGDKIEINYIASDNKPYKLAEIKMISKAKWKNSEEVLQIIAESNDDIIGGKVEDLSSKLSATDKELYIRMRLDILNLSNVTKPSGL